MRKSAQTVIRPDAYYTIAAANGRVLEVADFNTENGASVRLWSYEGQPWQQWQFVEAGDGEYRIRNRFTGKVMDLAMSGVCNGTWVHHFFTCLNFFSNCRNLPLTNPFPDGKVTIGANSAV